MLKIQIFLESNAASVLFPEGGGSPLHTRVTPGSVSFKRYSFRIFRWIPSFWEIFNLLSPSDFNWTIRLTCVILICLFAIVPEFFCEAQKSQINQYFPLQNCTLYPGMGCTLYDGMSPVRCAATVRQFQKNRKIQSKKVVHYTPESGVHYIPEWVVHFTPEYSDYGTLEEIVCYSKRKQC